MEQKQKYASNKLKSAQPIFRPSPVTQPEVPHANSESKSPPVQLVSDSTQKPVTQAQPTTSHSGPKWSIGDSPIHGRGVISQKAHPPGVNMGTSGNLAGKGRKKKIKVNQGFGSMINHQSGKKANMHFEEKGSSFDMKTSKPVMPGEELTADYDAMPDYILGSKPNYK